MSCDSTRRQLISFLKNELDPGDQLQMESHLGECEACRATLRHFETLWLNLDEGSELQPSSASHDRFHAFLDNEIALVAHNSGDSNPVHSWTSWFEKLWPSSPGGAVAYSLAIVLSSFLIGQGLPSGFFPTRATTDNEVASIQEELAELRDVMTLTLLRQDSIQARLRGVDYALQSGSNNPELISLLLETVDQDGAGNVRLAALDALELHRDNPLVQNRLSQTLSQETSPLVQLRKAELLPNAAGINRRQLLDTLLMEQILEAGVGEFLESLERDGGGHQSGGRLLEL
ncbi:MAG: zf-HC2 domain-containing protein [Pseudomonadales bacterium]|nr:zf-HC2 domain-containing protein [Pseudomonadales bacterium]